MLLYLNADLPVKERHTHPMREVAHEGLVGAAPAQPSASGSARRKIGRRISAWLMRLAGVVRHSEAQRYTMLLPDGQLIVERKRPRFVRIASEADQWKEPLCCL